MRSSKKQKGTRSKHHCQNHDKSATEDSCNLVTNLQRGKSMLERVSFLEAHLGKLCSAFSEFGSSSALIRDRNDVLAHIIAKFANDEYLNTTAKLSLKVVAELVASVGDHRNTEVKRIETKVLPTLSSYGNICKYLKNDIKASNSSLERENSSKRNLEKVVEKIADNSNGQFLIEMAENDYEKALAQSIRLQHLSREQMLKFEQKRIQDMKDSLQTFMKIEMAMHAKSLELLSDAYKYVESIDEEADLKVMKTEFGFDDPIDIESDQTVQARKNRKLKMNVKKARNTDNNSQDDASSVDWKDKVEKKLERIMSLTATDANNSEARNGTSSWDYTTDDCSRSSQSFCEKKKPIEKWQPTNIKSQIVKLSPRLLRSEVETVKNKQVSFQKQTGGTKEQTRSELLDNQKNQNLKLKANFVPNQHISNADYKERDMNMNNRSKLRNKSSTISGQFKNVVASNYLK